MEVADGGHGVAVICVHSLFDACRQEFFLSDFGEESDDCYFFCNMCATGFMGARQPGIDPCRRLVHSYATVG